MRKSWKYGNAKHDVYSSEDVRNIADYLDGMMKQEASAQVFCLVLLPTLYYEAVATGKLVERGSTKNGPGETRYGN